MQAERGGLQAEDRLGGVVCRLRGVVCRLKTGWEGWCAG